MKVSVNWINEYTKVELPIMELVEKIGAQLGAVEEVTDIGSRYKGIFVAKVVSCVKHDNADKLHVCLIDDGGKAKGVERNKDGLIQVVCGAPNVREGLKVVWLPPGTVVPSTIDKDPFTLEARDLRGVVSNGMLASARELAISDDHQGIVELEDTKSKPGDDFAATYGLDDTIIDIENKMFTHRPDCFGLLGVAREVAGITNKQFKSPKIYVEPVTSLSKHAGNVTLSVKNQAKQLVPRFVAQVFENVSVTSSPFWLQATLAKIGLRPINNIVDITNYFMYLTGQPLHAYDADKLCKVAGTAPKDVRLETRLSRKGDKLHLLNGKELSLQDDSTILITSNDVPVGVGGIMGGADTEVDATTRTIVLECATFDMYATRRTSMKYGLFTDAATRFTKGQSPLQNDRVVAWTATQIVSLSGGIATGILHDEPKIQPKLPAVTVSQPFINQRLGLQLEVKDMMRLLKNVEFTVDVQGEELTIIAPFWRTDIEIPEDIVEEVGRLYGFDHLPLVLPTSSNMPAPLNPMIEMKRAIRAILSGAGANELLTYSFVHGSLLEKVGQDPKEAFRLQNALSPDLQYYRVSLLPSLLEKVTPNLRSDMVRTTANEFALYEINPVHTKRHIDDNGLPIEQQRLALVIAKDAKTAKEYQGAPYYAAKAYLDVLLQYFAVEVSYKRLDTLKVAPRYEAAAAPFEPARSAIIQTREGKYLGVIGEYTNQTRAGLKLPMCSAGFELDLEVLHSAASQVPYQPLPKFPKVQQDISLKVPEDLTYQELYESMVKEIEARKPKNTLAVVKPITIFVPEKQHAHKHVTFRLWISAYDRTLRTEEVNSLLDETAAALGKLHHAERV